MPSTRDIRHRIKSVSNTAKITKAMQTVASSKMVKAQQSALNGRPFATLASALGDRISGDVSDYEHPLMEKREIRKRAIIVVSTDKGLCGALNSNVGREALKADRANTLYIAVGKKAALLLSRSKVQLEAEFLYSDVPTYEESRSISRFAQELFLSGAVDEVQVLFSKFVNTLSQAPETRTLLPLGEMRDRRKAEANERVSAEGVVVGGGVDYCFEPSPAVVLDGLLHYLADFEVLQILQESKASEHSARMVAMKNATDNAHDLIKDLTLEYNKLRQANITKELLEISSAAMSLG